MRAVRNGPLLLRLSILGLYLTLFPYHPRLRSPNELCRLWQARALVEYGTLDLNLALRDYGYVGDLSVKDGRYYPSKAPLLSFAAAPIYRALKAIGGGGRYAVPEIPQVYWSRMFLVILPTLAALGLLRRFLKTYFSSWIADFLVGFYAVGTLAFSYSLLFMSHQTTAVLLFVAFFALWRTLANQWPIWGFAIAGAAGGAAVAAEYTGAIGVLGLGVFCVLSCWRRLQGATSTGIGCLTRVVVLGSFGAAPFLAFLFWYHYRCFGSPLDTGYKYLADAAYQPWHTGGFLGIKFPDVRALGLSLFSPLRGLLVLSPGLVLAIPGLRWMWTSQRRPNLPPAAGDGLRPMFWMTLVLLIEYGYFTSSFSYESWGWTTGPRHLTPLIPFLLMPMGFCLQRLSLAARRFWLFGMGTGLCLASAVITGLVSFVDYIPDSASSALYGLAIPLISQGYLPPTVFALLGMANPWAGISSLALLLLFLIALGQLVFDAAPGSPKPLVTVVTGSTIAAVLLLLFFATPGRTPGDLGAADHLKSVWLSPPGAHLQFWSNRGAVQ